MKEARSLFIWATRTMLRKFAQARSRASHRGSVSTALPRWQIETKLNQLQRSVHARAFESKTTSQIIEEIITKHNLKAEVEEFGPKHNYTEQRNSTDYDYISQLAYKYGKTVWCQGNTIYVKTEITPSDDDVILEWGKFIISAWAKTNIIKQLSAATCTDWEETVCIEK